VPVVGVRVGDDPSTSGVPLVHQSGDGVQTDHTVHVGATDAGARERLVGRTREYGTGQVGFGQVRTEQGRFLSVSTPFWAGFAPFWAGFTPALVGFGRHIRGFDVFSG
jgi:hypothetical protein